MCNFKYSCFCAAVSFFFGFLDMVDLDPWAVVTRRQGQPRRIGRLCIRPARALNENRRKAMGMDYGMEDGSITLVVRKALQIYTCRRLGFIEREKPFRWVLIFACGDNGCGGMIDLLLCTSIL